MNRWLVVHLITSLKLQSVNNDCAQQILGITNDSNPLIRRLAIISLVDYIKTSPQSLEINETMAILKKSLNHPHPIIFSTVFYALSEIRNKNYVELGIPQRFSYFCENLNKVDDYYFERMVFTLVNFSKLFLFNNFDKNNKYIIKYI